MSRLLFALLLIAFTSAEMQAAGTIVEPTSYSKSVNHKGRYVFVQFGNIRVERENGTDKQKQAFVELRKNFPKPGLYRNGDTMELLWESKPEEFVPFDHAIFSDDGVYMVRIEGEFWKTESFPGGSRPPASAQEKQLNAPALSFLKNGVITKQYTMRELTQDPNQLQHTPEHLLWYASGKLIDETGHFIMYTQESNQYIFDYKTGEILSMKPVGLANPLLQKILIGCGVTTAIIAVCWIIFVIRRRVPDSVRLARQQAS